MKHGVVRNFAIVAFSVVVLVVCSGCPLADFVDRTAVNDWLGGIVNRICDHVPADVCDGV